MRADVVAFIKFGFQVGREVRVRGAGVCELGVAAVSRRREFVRAEEGEAGAAGVEGGVDVEEAVALQEHVSAGIIRVLPCVFLGYSAVLR